MKRKLSANFEVIQHSALTHDFNITDNDTVQWQHW